MRILFGLVLALWAGAVSAQSVTDCDMLNTKNVILNPIDMSTRTYANGEVSLTVIHDGRPRSNDSLFLVIFAELEETEEKRSCYLVGFENRRGYAMISLQGAQAEFTATDGLTVIVPARIYLAESDLTDPTVLSVNVNRATKEVNITQELNTE